MRAVIAQCLLSLALFGCGSDSPPTVVSTDAMCPEVIPENPTLVDGYYQLNACGWSVFMSADLFADNNAKPVYDALKTDLHTIQSRLPEIAVNAIRSVTIWLELDVPAFPGGVYHPSSQWLSDNGYPTKWAKGVQLGNAKNYLNWTEQQPAMVLHELAHAYDDQNYNHAHPALLDAYNAAMQAGIYDAVAYVDANAGLLEAYAATNAKEYFAELTEAYFWTNDYYPFSRTDLAAYDAAGFAAVEGMWLQP